MRPIKIKKIRNTDDPWITHAIRRKIRARKKVFRKEFRSTRWKQLKAETTRMIKEAKRRYYDNFTEQAKKTGDSSLYFRIVNRLRDRRAPENFCVTDLFPGQPHTAAAEQVADFFCSISDAFEQLTPDDLPPREAILLEE